MTPLAFPFTKDRFVHTLVARDGMVCLVARTNQLTASVHWEVVRLQTEPDKVIRGRRVPAHERYPSSGQWGSHGWTYTTRSAAEQKYRSLGSSTAVEAR